MDAQTKVPDQCRAKIKVMSMEYWGPQGDCQVKVSFTAVYKDDPGAENKFFWKYTPSLSFSMTLDKEAKGAIAFFEKMQEEGRQMYLDFTPSDDCDAPKPSPSL